MSAITRGLLFVLICTFGNIPVTVLVGPGTVVVEAVSLKQEHALLYRTEPEQADA